MSSVLKVASSPNQYGIAWDIVDYGNTLSRQRVAFPSDMYMPEIQVVKPLTPSRYKALPFLRFQIIILHQRLLAPLITHSLMCPPRSMVKRGREELWEESDEPSKKVTGLHWLEEAKFYISKYDRTPESPLRWYHMQTFIFNPDKIGKF